MKPYGATARSSERATNEAVEFEAQLRKQRMTKDTEQGPMDLPVMRVAELMKLVDVYALDLVQIAVAGFNVPDAEIKRVSGAMHEIANLVTARVPVEDEICKLLMVRAMAEKVVAECLHVGDETYNELAELLDETRHNA